mgnify:CR=1 FL=1
MRHEPAAEVLRRADLSHLESRLPSDATVFWHRAEELLPTSLEDFKLLQVFSAIVEAGPEADVTPVVDAKLQLKDSLLDALLWSFHPDRASALNSGLWELQKVKCTVSRTSCTRIHLADLTSLQRSNTHNCEYTAIAAQNVDPSTPSVYVTKAHVCRGREPSYKGVNNMRKISTITSFSQLPKAYRQRLLFTTLFTGEFGHAKLKDQLRRLFMWGEHNPATHASTPITAPRVTISIRAAAPAAITNTPSATASSAGSRKKAPRINAGGRREPRAARTEEGAQPPSNRAEAQAEASRTVAETAEASGSGMGSAAPAKAAKRKASGDPSTSNPKKRM